MHKVWDFVKRVNNSPWTNAIHHTTILHTYEYDLSQQQEDAFKAESLDICQKSLIRRGYKLRTEMMTNKWWWQTKEKK